MSAEEILEQYRNGTLSKKEALKRLSKTSFLDIGFAKIDTDRMRRKGFSEVIYCSGKTPEQVKLIFDEMKKDNDIVLGTKASEEHARVLDDVSFDKVSRLLIYEKKPRPKKGMVLVISAGTSDQPIAEEAAQTAELMGSKVMREFDCGVAGIHRLMKVYDILDKVNVVVAIAGMEGALATVVSGLTSRPIIAVPTSVGYGASFEGLAPLLTMMNSCAPGVSVVNIDNGFGAGYLSHMINMQSIGEKA